MTDIEKNQATIRRFWKAIASRDVDAYLATFAPGAVARDPVSQPALETVDQRRAYLEGVLAGLAEIETRIDFLTTCGDHSATKWTVLAKAADGSDVRIEGIDTARHDVEGLIAELWGYF